MDSPEGATPHRPLSASDPSEIRLVKIFPGNFDDQPRCELEHFSLDHDKPPGWFALSYTWGDPLKTSNIRLDGAEFPVTLNLHFFLQHMQVILLEIGKALPLKLSEPEYAMRAHRHKLVDMILKHRQGLPQGFPAVPERTMADFVRKHVDRLFRWEDLQGDRDLGSQDVAETFVYFWIDAVCINQRDLDEKNRQVSRIRHIYDRVPYVVIWLEDYSDPISEPQLATDLIREVYQMVRVVPTGRNDHHYFLLPTEVSAPDFVQDRVRAFESIVEVFQRQWFTRVWIIQEVMSAASPAVLIRFQAFEWGFLSAMIPSLVYELNPDSTHAPLLLRLRQAVRPLMGLTDVLRSYKKLRSTEVNPEGKEYSLVAIRLTKLLSDSAGSFQASDPRDRLYAFFGLLEWGDVQIPEQLQPNYKASVANIYWMIEIFMILFAKSLSPCAYSKRDMEGPSWVTDWRYCVKDDDAIEWPGSDLIHLDISDDLRHVKVDGHNLGKVIAVVPIPPASESSWRSKALSTGASGKEALTTAAGVLAVLKEMSTLRETCFSALQANNPNFPKRMFEREWRFFWPVLFGNEKLAKDRPSYDSWSIVSSRDGLPRRYNRDSKDTTLATILRQGGDVRDINVRDFVDWVPGIECLELCYAMDEISDRGGIAILSGGHLVTGVRIDDHIQLGDSVCLLAGMESPCILRPDGASHTLLGHMFQTSLRPDVLRDTTLLVERFDLI